jgi:hypothetical protein
MSSVPVVIAVIVVVPSPPVVVSPPPEVSSLLEPPQAASDTAMRVRPETLAALLAFFDSQADTILDTRLSVFLLANPASKPSVVIMFIIKLHFLTKKCLASRRTQYLILGSHISIFISRD